MNRTPTLQAAAAALGVLAGFALSPAEPAPLSGTVDELAVTVAWHVAAPSPEPAGVPLERAVLGDEAAQVKAHLTVLRMEKRRACPREQRQS